jgi:hypothetical protein
VEEVQSLQVFAKLAIEGLLREGVTLLDQLVVQVIHWEDGGGFLKESVVDFQRSDVVFFCL